jgi:TPR repeat protein
VDIKKEAYHLEEAAIGGHCNARHNLGCVELDFGRKERAVKHFIIAANLGNEKSIEKLMKFYVEGLICKQDFDEALLAYQAAVDATKSPQREAAAAEEEEARKN